MSSAEEAVLQWLCPPQVEISARRREARHHYNLFLPPEMTWLARGALKCYDLLYLMADIIITEWALQSYLSLKGQNAFSASEYWKTIRPDVELLRSLPCTPDVKFENDKFWGPATLKGGIVVPGGYKMKWRNMGDGGVQIRLHVAVLDHMYLCQSYIKNNESTDYREAAKLEFRIKQIKNGQYAYRGKL